MSEFPALEFVDDPPPSQRGNERLYLWFAQQLRENPGKWAKLPSSENKGGISTSIASGKFKAFRPEGHFEAVHRKDLDGDSKWTWVRFVGLRPTEEPSKPSTNGDLQRERNPDRAQRIDEALRNK